MRHYELLVVLSPMLNPDQVTETWDKVKGFITTIEEVLRGGDDIVRLENYKQHTQYASYRRGSWELSS